MLNFCTAEISPKTESTHERGIALILGARGGLTRLDLDTTSVRFILRVDPRRKSATPRPPNILGVAGLCPPRDRMSRNRFNRNEAGIALILVTFIIALATIVVTNLTYSTYMASRSNAIVEKSLSAEYLLKSCVNFAAALIMADTDASKDGPQDIWAKFSSGIPIPAALLDIHEPNVQIALEISPENQKFPLRGLLENNLVQVKLRDPLTLLFRVLGFDDDHKELQRSGKFKGKHFNSQELVANIIDYMDADDQSYQDLNSSFAPGIESDLPKNLFSNLPIDKVSELAVIPGFTPRRMRIVSPHLRTLDNTKKININFASKEIIKSLSDQIDDSLASQISDFARSNDGPFQSGTTKLQDIVGPNIYGQINTIVEYSGKYFQVIAKVDFGTKAYFARAIIQRNSDPSGPPEVRSLELF